jgi:cytochrome c-type biogenesis protein CcmH/NrfF
VYEFQKGNPPPLGRTMVVWVLVALLIMGGGAVAVVLLTKKRK